MARRKKQTTRAKRPPSPKQQARKIANAAWSAKVLAEGGIWLFGRLWVKQGDYYVYKRKLNLHSYIYKLHGGYKERGWHIHHVSVDPSDNRFENLIALPKQLHVHIHNLIRERGTYLPKAECQHLLDLLQSGQLEIPKGASHGVGKKHTPKNVRSNDPVEGILVNKTAKRKRRVGDTP